MKHPHPLPGLTVLEHGASGLPPGCHLAMCNRRGGVSPRPYDSLNVSFAVGDDPARVISNRERLASALGFRLVDLTFAAQAHGLRLQAVGPAERGRGCCSTEDAFPETDALLTEEPDTPLGILTADCYAVAVMGERAVAVAHAGWRGTLGNLAGHCVQELGKRGNVPEELTAYLGPGIRKCCYTVDEGRAAAFVERYNERCGVVSKCNEEVRLDLELANKMNLLEAGLRMENIFSQGDCVACNPEYFSFRRDGITGRQAMLIWMSEKGAPWLP